MCSMEKKNIMSCQISYLPIASNEYIQEVNQVLAIIECYKVEYNVGILATTIRGQADIVF